MSNIEEDNKNLNEPEDQFVNYSFDDDEPVSGGTYTLDDIENHDGIDGEATYIDSDDDVDDCGGRAGRRCSPRRSRR